MRRYWFDVKMHIGDEILINGDLFHHIFAVCRQTQGSKFEMLSGGGRAYFVEVSSVGKKEARAQILEERVIPPLEKPHLHLAVSVPKFQTMELIVEKSVELGVFELHPFVSDFSFVRKVDQRLQGKAERWKRIIQGATQQCGRGDLMKLADSVSLQGILAQFNRRTKAVGLIPYEGVASKHVRQALGPLKLTAPEEVWVFVGSEGGYSPQEVATFEKSGINSVTLGSQVLRVETACLALVSILKYEWELMK